VGLFPTYEPGKDCWTGGKRTQIIDGREIFFSKFRAEKKWILETTLSPFS